LLKVLRLFQLEPIDIEDIMKAAKKGEQVLIRLLRNLIPIILILLFQKYLFLINTVPVFNLTLISLTIPIPRSFKITKRIIFAPWQNKQINSKK
jgi:hypothetical protein